MGKTTFVFDVGGVLVSLNPEARRRLYSLAKPLDKLDEGERRRMADAGLAYRVGRCTTDEYLQVMTDVLGISGADVIAAECALIEPGAPAMRELVRELRRTHRVVAFSVTQAIHWDHVHNRLLGVDCFDACYLSHERGSAKPEPESFADIAKAEGLMHDDVVFIDDSAENIAAAREHGWTHCIHHRSPEDTIARVREIVGSRS